MSQWPAVQVDFLTAYAVHAEEDHMCPAPPKECSYCVAMRRGERVDKGSATVWRVPMGGPEAPSALQEALRLVGASIGSGKVSGNDLTALKAMKTRLGIACRLLGVKP